MSPSQVCPSQELLSDYLLGKLSEEESVAVTDHLKVCGNCLSRIDEVDESLDSIVHRLKHPAPDDEFMNEPECKEAVAANHRLPREHETDLGQVRDYRLVAKLGQGGMGAVYKAIHTQLDRPVAIKILPPERMQSSESVGRFRREIKAVGKLDHPNIVRAQDAGEEDGKYYLVMEIVEGVDLSALVNRVGPLPVADCCELIRQAAVGLQHVHEHGFIHRDIKPSNLMVTAEGSVKVLDLGLARLHEDARESKELTVEGQVMGTLDYMAPEQLGDSHTVGIRADIYGLGATMFKLLSGEAPYAGKEYKTPTKKLVAIATKPAPPIAEFRSDIPKGLIAVLGRMFAKNPDDRYTQPSQIVEALEPFTKGCDLPALVAAALPATDPVVAEAGASTLAHVTSALTDTKPTPTLPNALPATHVGSSTPWFKQPAAIVVAALFFVVAALAVYHVTTNNGTILVEVDDGQIEVILKQHGIVVHDLRNNRQWTVWEPGETRVSVGEYRLTVKDDSGLEIETEEFTLKRGGNKIVSVRYQLPPPPAPKGDSPPDVVADKHSGGQQINREPIAFKPRSPLARSAFVTKPASLPGVLSWTIATREAMFAAPSVRYSPDGGDLALGGFDGEIRVRDAYTDRLKQVLVGHDGSVTALEWAPHDPIIATGGADFTVRLWDATTGQPLRVMTKHTGAVVGVAWKPDGKTIVSVGDETLRVWDASTGQLLETEPTSGVTRCVDCTQRHIATGNTDGTITIRDAETLQIVQEVTRSQPVEQLKWSPNGLLLASPSAGGRGKILILDGLSGAVQTEIDTPGAMAWSPDGTQLLAGGGIWDIRTGERTLDLPKLPRWFHHADWSTHGNNIVVEANPATVFSSNLTTPDIVRVHRSYPSQARANSSGMPRIVAWSTNGKTVLTYAVDTSGASNYSVRWALSDGSLQRWDAEGNVSSTVRPVWLSDGETLISAKPGDPSRFISRDNATDGTIREFSGHRSPINALAASPDSRFVVSTSWDETARVWNVKTGEEVQVLPHDFSVWGVVYSPSGRWIATHAVQYGGAGYVDVWDAQELGRRQLHVEVQASSFAFSTDSETFAVSDQKGAIQLWDVATAKRFDVIENLDSPPGMMRWIDNKTVATVDKDGAARVRDLGVDKLRPKKVDLPGAVIASTAFSPDGTMIALAADDVMWIADLSTGRSRAHLALRDGQHLTLSEDGHFAGSPRVERLFVYVVQTEEGQETLTPSEFAAKYDWTNDPSRVRFESVVPVEAPAVGDASLPTPDSTPGDAVIKRSSAESPTVETNEPISSTALVTRPAELAGAKTWSIETVVGRSWGAGQAAISPDGALLAVGNPDGAVRIYDLRNGEVVHVWSSRSGTVRSVDWSPDGKQLAVVGGDSEARVLDFPTGRVVHAFNTPGGRLVSWAPQTGVLAVAGPSLFLWDGEAVQRVPDVQAVRSLAWSPDGGTLAVGGWTNIQLWRIDGLELLNTLETPNDVLALAWSPSGKKLASGRSDGQSHLWNPFEGTLIHSFDADSFRLDSSFAGNICWSPDSQLVAFTGAREIRFYNSNSGKKQSGLRVSRSGFSSWSGDGKTFVHVKSSGGVSAFDMPEQRLRFELHKGQTEGAAGMASWSPDGRALVYDLKDDVGDYGHLTSRLWNLNEGLVWTSTSPVFGWRSNSLWSHNRRFRATMNPKKDVCILENGVLTRTLDSTEGEAVGFAWGPAGERIAVATSDTVQIWNVLTGESEASISHHDGGITRLAWDPCESMAVATTEGLIRLWNVATQELITTADHAEEISHLTSSPDGATLASVGASSGLIRIWDAKNGRPVRSSVGRGPLSSLAWSADGKMVMCAGLDGQIGVWNTARDGFSPETRFNVGVVQGRSTLSPEGTLLATQDHSTSWLYRVATGESLGSITGLREGRVIQIGSEGHYMASSDVSDEIVYVVELDSGERLTLSQEEFERRFGWKNEPRKAQVSVD